MARKIEATELAEAIRTAKEITRFAEQKGRHHPRIETLLSSLVETIPLYVEASIRQTYIRGMSESTYGEYVWWIVTSFLHLTMRAGDKLGYADRDDCVTSFLAEEATVTSGNPRPPCSPTKSIAQACLITYSVYQGLDGLPITPSYIKSGQAKNNAWSTDDYVVTGLDTLHMLFTAEVLIAKNLLMEVWATSEGKVRKPSGWTHEAAHSKVITSMVHAFHNASHTVSTIPDSYLAACTCARDASFGCLQLHTRCYAWLLIHAHELICPVAGTCKRDPLPGCLQLHTICTCGLPVHAHKLLCRASEDLDRDNYVAAGQMLIAPNQPR